MSVNEAAQRLVTGDLPAAAALLPDTSRDLLIAGYSGSFSTLIMILTSTTILTAAVVFHSLDRGQVEDEDEDETVVESANIDQLN